MFVVIRRRLALGLILVPLFCAGGLLGRTLPRRGAERTRPEAGTAVVIDPGHGGVDGGCQDIGGNMEKDLNLAVARCLAAHLAGAGLTPLLTRTDDRELGATYGQDLRARLETARQIEAAALISIHANWYTDPAAEGALAVIPPGSPQSARLARIILTRMRPLCQVNPEPLVMPDHGLLVKAAFPIVLIEIGFLSNPREAARLSTQPYQDALGSAVAMGIRDYFASPPAGSGRPTPTMP